MNNNFKECMYVGIKYVCAIVLSIRISSIINHQYHCNDYYLNILSETNEYSWYQACDPVAKSPSKFECVLLSYTAYIESWIESFAVACYTMHAIPTQTHTKVLM